MNDIGEMKDIFKKTKNNLTNYKVFLNGVKHNLSSLNKLMSKAESNAKMPTTLG